MRQKIYTIVTGRGVLRDTTFQLNEGLTRGLATATQCQKRHHHLNGYQNWFAEFVMVLFLAFLRTMLTLQEFKKSLGKRASTLTDAQIEGLRLSMYKVADGLFDNWKRPKKEVPPTKVVTYNKNGNYASVVIFVPSYV